MIQLSIYSISMENSRDIDIQAKNTYTYYYHSRSVRIASYVLCECLYIQWVLQSLPKEDKWTDRWRRILENTTNVITFQKERIKKLLPDSDIEKCPAITDIPNGFMDVYSKYLTAYLETKDHLPSLLRRYLDPLIERVPLLKIY